MSATGELRHAQAQAEYWGEIVKRAIELAIVVRQQVGVEVDADTWTLPDICAWATAHHEDALMCMRDAASVGAEE
jgi:hypothetical protein